MLESGGRGLDETCGGLPVRVVNTTHSKFRRARRADRAKLHPHAAREPYEHVIALASLNRRIKEMHVGDRIRRHEPVLAGLEVEDGLGLRASHCQQVALSILHLEQPDREISLNLVDGL